MTCSYGKCKTTAKWRFSPDIDIEGLLACDKHLEIVRMAYAALMLSGDEDMCYKLLKRSKETQQSAPRPA